MQKQRETLVFVFVFLALVSGAIGSNTAGKKSQTLNTSPILIFHPAAAISDSGYPITSQKSIRRIHHPLQKSAIPFVENVASVGNTIPEQLSPLASVATISDAFITSRLDPNGNGYACSVRLNWNADVEGLPGSTLRVFEKIFIGGAGDSHWSLIQTMPVHTITGTNSSDTQSYFMYPMNDFPMTLNFRIEVYREGAAIPDDYRDSSNDSDLEGCRLEGEKITSLCSALDSPSLQWRVYGDSAWFEQTSVTLSGASAARSGKISHGQSSIMWTTVTGPGTLSFWWKVSSEESFDRVWFFDAKTTSVPTSGEKDWHQKMLYFPEGNHDVHWEYSKNATMSMGHDCGWVDGVIWTPGPPFTPTATSTLTPTPAPTPPGSTATPSPTITRTATVTPSATPAAVTSTANWELY